MTCAIALTQWIRMRQGVAHTSDARAAGFTKADAAAAVATGLLRRVRRSWLVDESADERRVIAVTAGGRTTCVTQAELLGLWVPEHDAVHVVVPATASRIDSAGLRLHWTGGPAPVPRFAHEDALLNVLFHVARCVRRIDALCIWESAINRRLVHADLLQRVAWASPDARAIARVALGLSESGLETVFADGLRRLGVAFRQQVWLEGHRVDVLIGERLVVQLDGFAHYRAADRRRDLRHDAILTMRGYTVLRFDYHQLLFEWAFVEETVVQAMARGMHLARAV
jgi:very-short-patch-repair endonuclease